MRPFLRTLELAWAIEDFELGKVKVRLSDLSIWSLFAGRMNFQRTTMLCLGLLLKSEKKNIISSKFDKKMKIRILNNQ